MSQHSQCNKCGSIVVATRNDAGRAFYQCSCGKRWSTKAYYGRRVVKDDGDYEGTGAILGGLLGGIPGMLYGAITGSFIRDKSEVTSDCLVCGGTGRPTGFKGKVAVFQCPECYRTWTARW